MEIKDWNSARKVMGKLTPQELFEILTRGRFKQLWSKIEHEIISINGIWYISNWGKNDWGSPDIKIDTLSIYMTDSVFEVYVSKGESIRMKTEIESWGIFKEIRNDWYNDFLHTLNFEYDPEIFKRLYLEWKREKILNDLEL